MLKERKTLLHERVNQIDTLRELNHILNIINFEDLKEYVHQQIDVLEEPLVNNAYFHSMSIDGTLPSDVVQHILTFDDLYSHRVVSKKWIETIKTHKAIKIPHPFKHKVNTKQQFDLI